MAKLYFRYGTVSSAKTALLLATAYKYEQQGKKVAVIKPKLDTRFGKDIVRSRIGIDRIADLSLNFFNHNDRLKLEKIIEEKPEAIEYFREITITKNIPVVAFGLRTDFKTKFFEGSKRLMELADDIQEVKTICQFSNKKATMNLKHVNNEPVFDGPSVELGAEEKYYPVSYEEYYKAYRKKFP